MDPDFGLGQWTFRAGGDARDPAAGYPRRVVVRRAAKMMTTARIAVRTGPAATLPGTYDIPYDGTADRHTHGPGAPPDAKAGQQGLGPGRERGLGITQSQRECVRIEDGAGRDNKTSEFENKVAWPFWPRQQQRSLAANGASASPR